MAPSQEYFNEESERSYFTVSSFNDDVKTIQEKPGRLTLTNPRISKAFLVNTDVFGETLDSIDVWAEEDVFLSPRKSPRTIRKHSHLRSRCMASSKAISQLFDQPPLLMR